MLIIIVIIKSLIILFNFINYYKSNCINFNLTQFIFIFVIFKLTNHLHTFIHKIVSFFPCFIIVIIINYFSSIILIFTIYIKIVVIIIAILNYQLLLITYFL